MRILIVMSLTVALAYGKPNLKIIGGEDSAKGRWPWQLSLQIKDAKTGTFQHSCGASLLSANWALTAAHCIVFSNPDNYVLKAGGFSLPEDDFEQVINVAEIIRHPNFDWDEPGFAHDIGLLRLASPADLSNPNIGTVRLPEAGADMAGNRNCFITGWGRNDRESYDSSPLLQEARVPVITNERCEVYYEDLANIPYHRITDNHICVGEPDVEDISACHGDSGGPLQCDMGNGDWRIGGVTSRGGSRQCNRYPSVYMRVSMFLDWIRQHVPNV